MRKKFVISKKRVKLEGPELPAQSRCIGCDRTINPTFSYTGTLKVNPNRPLFFDKRSTERLPIRVSGVAQAYDGTAHAIMVGGELVETKRTIPFVKRKKGYVCSDCAGHYPESELRLDRKVSFAQLPEFEKVRRTR